MISDFPLQERWQHFFLTYCFCLQWQCLGSVCWNNADLLALQFLLSCIWCWLHAHDAISSILWPVTIGFQWTAHSRLFLWLMIMTVTVSSVSVCRKLWTISHLSKFWTFKVYTLKFYDIKIKSCFYYSLDCTYCTSKVTTSLSYTSLETR